MTDKGVEAQDRELWRRWRALGGQTRLAEPNALLLAAYAEGRLSEIEAAPVEAWLASMPEALGDLLTARRADREPPALVDERALDKACALVPDGGAPAGAEILPFRPRLPQWRTALAWSSIAASILCASLIGFSMGSDAYANLSSASATDVGAADALGTTSLDSYFSDDSGT